jgi:hypothetical protein
MLVRKIRDADLFVELAAKRARVDELLRLALRQSRGPITRDDAPADVSTSAAGDAARRGPTTATPVRLASPTDRDGAWVRARDTYQDRGASKARRRRFLMSAVGTSTLALSAYALLSMAGLPSQGPLSAAAATSAGRVAFQDAARGPDSVVPDATPLDVEAAAAHQEPTTWANESSASGALAQTTSSDGAVALDVDQDGSGVLDETGLVDTDATEAGDVTVEIEPAHALGTVFATGVRGVNLRMHASAQSKSLQLLEVGSSVEILGGRQRLAGETWQQIRTVEGLEGWVVVRALR